MSTYEPGHPPVAPGGSPHAAGTHRRSDLSRAQARIGYAFVLPSFVLYLAFVLAPVLVTVYLSFTQYDPLGGATWVGFDNYHRFLTDDRSLQIFWNTLRFTVFAVCGNVGIGLLLALALNRAMPAFLLYLFRLSFFLPVIIAAAFVSIVWGYFYGDDLGWCALLATLLPHRAALYLARGLLQYRLRVDRCVAGL